MTTVLILNAAPLRVNLDAWPDALWGAAVLLAVVAAVPLSFYLVDLIGRHLRYLALFRAQERRVR